MHMSTTARAALAALLMAGAIGLGAASPVHAFPLRTPQVPLLTGWDGISLQSYFDGVGEGSNTLTQQADLQTWQAPASGAASFALRMEIAGYAGQNSVGIYNASQVSPSTFLVFPGAAAPGWYAHCLFTLPDKLNVKVFDSANVLQGTTNYVGVELNNFGFYLQGPAGTFYSQDARNAGGKPQAITFAGTGPYVGKFWECFEDLPYASSDVDFQDSILLLESVAPTVISSSTWAGLKARFR
jgi:hypothetical protein